MQWVQAPLRVWKFLISICASCMLMIFNKFMNYDDILSLIHGLYCGIIFKGFWNKND